MTSIQVPVTTLPIPRDPTILETKTKYDGLKARAEKVAGVLQAAFEAEDKGTVENQTKLLVALGDFKLLQKLFTEAEQTWNGINLAEVDPATIPTDTIEGGLTKMLAELCKDLIDVVVETYGVSKESVMPAVSQGIAELTDIIGTIVPRVERMLGIDPKATIIDATATVTTAAITDETTPSE